jgi:hypothetical protein
VKEILMMVAPTKKPADLSSTHQTSLARKSQIQNQFT